MSSSWAINTLRRVAVDLQRFSDGRRIDEDQLDAFRLSLHLAYRELAALECFNMLDSCGQLAMECVRRALENIERMQEEDDEQEYRHPVTTGNHAGASTVRNPSSPINFPRGKWVYRSPDCGDVRCISENREKTAVEIWDIH